MQEAFKALEMQTNNQNAPEIKAETEIFQEAESKVKHPGKERKKGPKSDTITKSTKSRADDGGEPATKPKPKSAKATRGQQRVEENQSNPQDSKRAVRGQRDAAARAASQPGSQSEAKTRDVFLLSRQKATDAGEEAADAGPRRSKRIASRK